ncbi:hypothetical protein Tsubulata_009435 [Turnera subulata]|uniref:DUF4283 domain-containing protein n=1 Tax=Turnera subulata TaxID=218843 RepID=A0A9Q0JHM1_9ROSI|nr:hypothetical protein Tsubulata_009435 [Turnera subulata]
MAAVTSSTASDADALSVEETDQQERSTKKAKRTGERSEVTGMSVEDERLPSDEPRRKISYKSMLSGRSTTKGMEDVPVDDGDEYWSEESDPEDEDDEDPYCPTILLSSADKKRIYKRWKNTLIVKLLGKRVGYRFLHRSLMYQWKPRGEIIMADMGNDFYLLQFNTEYDYNRVLFDGPWLVADHVLMVRRWQPCFDPDEAVIDKAIVWIQLPKLYHEFYDRDILLRIARRAGRPIKVDEVTLKSSRGKYARVCVEVDLTKPLVSKFRLKRRVWRVVYEGLDTVCFMCGHYGHTLDKCLNNPLHEDEMEMANEGGGLSMNEPETEKAEVEDRPELISNHGPWMLAQKKRRGRPKAATGDPFRKMSGGQPSGPSGSRFTILHDHQEPEIGSGPGAEVRVSQPHGLSTKKVSKSSTKVPVYRPKEVAIQDETSRAKEVNNNVVVGSVVMQQATLNRPSIDAPGRMGTEVTMMEVVQGPMGAQHSVALSVGARQVLSVPPMGHTSQPPKLPDLTIEVEGISMTSGREDGLCIAHQQVVGPGGGHGGGESNGGGSSQPMLM